MCLDMGFPLPSGHFHGGIHAQFPWRSSLFSDKPNESVQNIPSKEWLIYVDIEVLLFIHQLI